MDTTTNVGMRRSIEIEDRRREKVVERLGTCCQRRVGVNCMYLCRQCPDMTLAAVILQETRGLR